MKNKENHWTNNKFQFWATIFAVPIGIVLMKALPHISFLDNLFIDWRALRTVSIESTLLNANTVSLKINSEGFYGFKDIKLQCSYIGESGTTIDTLEFIVYKGFEHIGSAYTNITVDSIPHQSVTIKCDATDLTVFSKGRCSYKLNSSNKSIFDKCYYENI